MGSRFSRAGATRWPALMDRHSRRPLAVARPQQQSGCMGFVRVFTAAEVFMKLVSVLIVGVAVTVAVGGCATAPGAHARWHTGWDKPGMTGEAFEMDVRDCDREANRVAAMEPGHRAPQQPGGARTTGPGPMASQRQIEHERAYSDCMKNKGYTATKS
jgi:hypothetical protein